MKKRQAVVHVLAIGVVCFGACLAPAAHAALTECDPVRGAFTVYLSEPDFTQAVFKSDKEMKDFMTRLTRELDDAQDRR